MYKVLLIYSLLCPGFIELTLMRRQQAELHLVPVSPIPKTTIVEPFSK